MDLLFSRLLPYNAAVMLTIIATYFAARIVKRQGVLRLSLDYDYSFGYLKTFVVGLPLFVLPALQYRVGIDYDSYVTAFRHVEFSRDIGFDLVIQILNFLTDNAQVLFVFVAFVFVYLFLDSFFKYSAIPCLSIFLFLATACYTGYGFNVIRQGMALAITVFSLLFISLFSFSF